MEPWVASLQSASGSDPYAVVFEALALLSHSTNTTAGSAVNNRTNPDAAILKASLIGQNAESIVTSTCRSIVAAAWWSSREAVAAVVSSDVELMDELMDRRGATGQQQPVVTPLTVAVAALRHLREGAPAQLSAETVPSELTLAATSNLKHLLGHVVDTAQSTAQSVTVNSKRGGAQKAPANDSAVMADLFSGRSKANICTRHPLRSIARIAMVMRGSANAAGAGQGETAHSQRMTAAITDALLNATEVAQTAATTQGTSSSASLPTRDAIGNFHKLLARLLDSIGNAQSMAVKCALLQTIVTYLQYCSVLLTESVLPLVAEDICEDVTAVTAKNRRAQKRNALFKRSQTNEQNKANFQEEETKNQGSKRLFGFDRELAVASSFEGISYDEAEGDSGEHEEQHEDPLLVAQIWHELSIEVCRLLLPPQWLSDTLSLLPEAALTLAYDAYSRHQQTCLDDASASGPALAATSSPPPHGTAGLSGGTYSTAATEQALHLPLPVLTALRNSLSFSSLANTDSSIVLSYANHSSLAETALECMDSLLVEPTAEATGHFSLLGVGGSGGGAAASPAALVGSDAAVFGLKLSPQCAHDFLFSCRQLHPCLRHALNSLMSVSAQQRAANATTVLLWDHVVRSHIDHGRIYENSPADAYQQDCTYLASQGEEKEDHFREKKGMILGTYRSVGEALAAEGIAPLASNEVSRAAPYVFYDEPPALLPIAGCHYVNTITNQQSLPTLQQSHNTTSSAAHFYSVRGAGANPSLASMSVVASPSALLTPPHHTSGGGLASLSTQQQSTAASSSFKPSSSLLKQQKPSGLLGNTNNTPYISSSPQPKGTGAVVQQKKTVSNSGVPKKNKKNNKYKNRSGRCVSLEPIAVAVAQLDSVFSTWGSSAVSNGTENCRTIVAEDLFFEAIRACLTEVDEKNKSLAHRLVDVLNDLNAYERNIENNKSLAPQAQARPPTSTARPLVSTKNQRMGDIGGHGMVYSSGDSSSTSSSSDDNNGDSEGSLLSSDEESNNYRTHGTERRRRQAPIASLLTEVVEYLPARENTATLLLQAAVGSPKIYLALASTANFRTSSLATSLASAGDKRLSAVLGWECPRLMHARWSLLPAICQAVADRHEAFRTLVTLLSDALKKLGEAKKELSSAPAGTGNRQDVEDEDNAEEAERLAYESMRKVLQQQREFDTNVILPLPVALLKFLDKHWNSMPTLRQIKEVLAAEWIVTDEARLLDLVMGPRTSSGRGADLITLLADITLEASAKLDTQNTHHRGGDPANSQSPSPSGSPLRLLNSRSNTSFSLFSSSSSMSPSFAYSPSPTGRMIRAQTASGILIEDGRGHGSFTGATSLCRKGGSMGAAVHPSSLLIEPFLYQFDADGLRDDGGARRRAARGGGVGVGGGFGSPQSGKMVGIPSAAAIDELLQTIQTSNSSGAVATAALVLLTSSFASSNKQSSSSSASASSPSVSRLSSVLSAVTVGFSKAKARQALSSITSIASFITVHSSPSAAIRIINAAESLLSCTSSFGAHQKNIVLAYNNKSNTNKNDVQEEVVSQQRLLNALYQISAHLASTAPPGHLVAFFPLLLKTFQSLSVVAKEMAAESEQMMKRIESSYANEVEGLRSIARSLVKVARQLAATSPAAATQAAAYKEEELTRKKVRALQTKYEELFAAICDKRRIISAMKKRFVEIRNQDAARQCVVYLESTRALRELLHHLAFRVTELPNNWLTGNALLQCVASYLASTTAPDVLMRREADLAAKTLSRTRAEDLTANKSEDTDDEDTENDENSESETDDQLNANEKATARPTDEGLIDSDCDGDDEGCPELKNALRCMKAIAHIPINPFISRNYMEKSVVPVPTYKNSDSNASSPKIPASIVSRCSAELALTAPTAESFLKAMAKHFSSPAVGEHTAVILTLLHHLPTRQVSSMLQVDAAADTADTLNFCERRTMHSAVLPSVKPFTITAVLGEPLRRRIMADGSIPEEDSQTLAATSVASYTEQTDLCLKISLEVTDPTIPESVPELAAGIIHIYSTTPGVVLSTAGALGSSLAESASSPQRSIVAGPTPSVSAAGFANTMGSSSTSFNSSHANSGGVFLAMPLCGNKVRLPSADGPTVISTSSEESQRITAAPVVRLCPPITTIIRVTDPRPITLAANFIGADGKEVPLCIRTRREQTTATLASMGFTLQSSREASKSTNKSCLASLTRTVNPTLTLETARYVYAVSRTQPLASSSGSAPSASTALADLIHTTQREVPIEFALRLAAALQSRATFCLQRNTSSAFRGGIVGSLSSGAARGAKSGSLSSSSLAPHTPTSTTVQQPLDPPWLFFVYVCPGDVFAIQIAPVHSTTARVGCGYNPAAARLIADLEGYLSSSSDDDEEDEEGTRNNLKQRSPKEEQHSSKIINSSSSSKERASVHIFSGKSFLLGLADRILDEFVAEL